MRNQSIEVLRIIAAFFVVWIHVNPKVSALPDISNLNKHALFWFDVISRGGLPIFFMISGYFLLNEKKNKPLITISIDRLIKLIIPFMVFFLLDISYRNGFNIFNIDFLLIYTKSILNSAQSTSAHYWFVYAMIGLYLIYPILNRVFSIMDSRTILKISALLLAIKIYQVYYSIALKDLTYLPKISFPLVDTWFLYFILGRAIREIPKKKYEKQAVILAIFGVSLTGLAVSLGNEFKAYDAGLNMYIYCSAIFYLFHSMDFDFVSTRKRAVISIISKNTYGIYLIHIFVFQFIVYGKMGIKGYVFKNPIIWDPVTVFIVFFISLVISMIANFFVVDPLVRLASRRFS